MLKKLMNVQSVALAGLLLAGGCAIGDQAKEEAWYVCQAAAEGEQRTWVAMVCDLAGDGLEPPSDLPEGAIAVPASELPE